MAVLRAGNGEREFPLGGEMTIIGRDASCDIVLRAAAVSARHAMVVKVGGVHYIEDLGSLNGTYVNGKRIRQRTRLAPNDRLDFGGQTLTFHDGEPTAGGLDELPAPDDQPAATGGSAILSSLDVAGGLRTEIAAEAKLRAVLELSQNLSTTLELEKVLPKTLESLFAIFPQADRGFILLRDPDTGQLVPKAVRHRRGHADEAPAVSRTILHHALTTGRAILSVDAGHDQRFDPSHSVHLLAIHSILCVPMISRDGTPLGVIQLDTRDKAKQFSQEDLHVLVSASTQAARAVDLARLHQERRDLEAATQIQKSFLPDEHPRLDQLRFFDHYSSALQIGGDYYDFIPLPGDRLAVAVGDVSGKGVAAALLMARLSAAARFCLASEPKVAAAVRQLNTLLTRSGPADRFITFVVAVLSLNDWTVTVVNAGHPPPLRLAAGQPAVEYVGEHSLGLPLGVIDRPYQQVVVPLAAGDTLVLYTDGVTEARNPAGDMYGVERLRAVLRAAPEDVTALGEAILADVRRFAADRPQGDDLTLVCCGRRPG